MEMMENLITQNKIKFYKIRKIKNKLTITNL